MDIERFIKERPKEADALAFQWQEFAKQNPEVLSFDTADEFYAWAANHPGTDTSIWTGNEIQEAYFYLRDRHEDEQMQTQGQVNSSNIPAELIALPILALAFRDRPKIIEDDKDYQKLVEQHKKLWLEKNPGKDFNSKEGLDYLHGSLDDQNAPALKKDAEQAFRNNPKYKKRIERYDKEGRKIYKNIDDDPRVIRTREEIEAHIKARQEYLKTHEEDKKPEDVSRIIQKQSWERFARKHPEKAKIYGQSNIDIKKAYEKEEIKKQLSDLEQKTGRQVRYVEKIHRPQGISVEEATRRLESIIPSQPRPIPPEPRTTIPQAVGRGFRPPGRRVGLGIGRLGTRLVTQAGMAAGRAAVGALASNPIGWVVIGVIVAIIIIVFLIIMLAGGGGGGQTLTPGRLYECAPEVNTGMPFDYATSPASCSSGPEVDCVIDTTTGATGLVANGNTCAANAATYYSNLEGVAITANCIDKCTDIALTNVCDRNAFNACTSPTSVCGGANETFCIEYITPTPTPTP